MNALWIAVALWLVSLLFLAGDILAARFDARAAGDRVATGRSLPPRLHRMFWLFPVGALLSAFVAVGGAYAAVLIAAGSLLPGIVVVLTVVVLAAGVVLVCVAAATRRHRPGYASLRFRLLAAVGTRLTAARIARFRSEFAEIDARSSRIPLPSRRGARSLRLRKELEHLSAALLVEEPSRTDVVRAVRWSSANTYLFGSSPWRLASIVLGLVVGAVALLPLAERNEPWVAALTALPAPASYVLALVASRYYLASKATWHAVHLSQRAEVLRLIEEFERSARKGVAGLGDRVTRALQILREQQQLG